MDRTRFWSLIDTARATRRKPADALVDALSALPPSEIVDFDAWFWAYYSATRREDLWAAVHAILGGCSDDRFDYFRAWLISRGEDVVLAAIRDPESLIELMGGADARDEAMLSAASKAHMQAGAGELPPSDGRPWISVPTGEWPADRVEPGQRWDGAFYATTFPKLYARYFAGREPAPTGAISRSEFFAMLDAARAGTETASAAVKALAENLGNLSTHDLIGFARWLGAYNQALMREDLRAACLVLLGKTDVDTVAGFRGWLILQGETAIHSATHDLDALLEHVQHPVSPCKELIFVAWGAFGARGIYPGVVSSDDLEAIPDIATFAPDWPAVTPSVAELRARLPRLTAGRTDEQLRQPVRRGTRAAPLDPPSPVRVRHAKFGEGVVVATDLSSSGEPKLVIDFDGGRKTIASRFVETID